MGPSTSSYIKRKGHSLDSGWPFVYDRDMNTYQAGDAIWYNNVIGEVLDPSTMNIPRTLRHNEVFISHGGQKFTIDYRYLFPFKKAEAYSMGSILSYRADDPVYGKLLVKTGKGYWHVARADSGNMGTWSDGEVNMGLRQGGSISVVLDNEVDNGR